MTQLVQIISGIIIAAATTALAIITYKYMKSTKIMADSMELQSKIMTREFEKRVSPIIDLILQRSQTNSEKGKYHYAVCNLGNEPVKLKEVKTRYWQPDEPEREFAPIIKPINKLIAASPSSIEVDVEINFSKINQINSESQFRKKILKQSIFIIENVDHEEFEIEDIVRKIC